MFKVCPSRGLGQGGNQCQGTGDRIGRAIPTSMAKPSPSKSQPAMELHSSTIMSFLLVGNLDRPLKVVNSRLIPESNGLCIFTPLFINY